MWASECAKCGKVMTEAKELIRIRKTQKASMNRAC